MTNDKESEEIDKSKIQKLFEEEITKPYYKIDYLNDFKLPYKKLDVSIIIPTKNRSPYKPNSLKSELNPLAWAIDSCLIQKPKINEIIIIDDKSNDYTKQVVESFRDQAKKADVKLIYIKNKVQLGNGASRNVGSRLANSKYLFFTDDDLIMAPYAVFGAYYTFELLEKKGEKIGLVGLPVYFRKSFPSKILSKKEIGILDYTKGIIKPNKDAFIQELLTKEKSNKFLDNELNILNPIEIQNTNAYGICLRQAFEDVGGFPNKIVRGEDREFGSKLIENGYDLYFSCDIKFQGVHGMFGFNNGVLFEGQDWFRQSGGKISLKKMMKECDKPKESTGARVGVNQYIYQQIMSFFISTYKRNKKGAINWTKRVYKNFVLKGDSASIGSQKIPPLNEEERKSMWLSAINQGLKFVRDEEKKALQKLNKTIRELQKESKADKNIISILERL
ncbi:glycosyltransferase family 2 protein [archaeon]|jgi:glycosyltransferase involved in cell wall biosynthesis|nr:glycosyltransferase family 2 protein [archaeon]MBT4373539.1 glycosyltransferase family 2 protein [archaeon]MBT4531987.1 glycosyltransferase family 2 protein [archaeon]MBT7001654.1 glycosyltransferase family 2 protein [archaeon]MBT7282454.1 glycosyltransferase family 2 protein [archaeon]